MALADTTASSDFDSSAARALFEVTNFEYFTQVYMHRVWPYYPFIHIATFDYERASLPLLLAVFLTGALHAPPTSSAVSARRFLNLAEEFIFSHPTMKGLLLNHDSPFEPATEVIEILQAGLAILYTQISINDEATRCRIRVKRYPFLSTVVRLVGILQAKHPIPVPSYDANDWNTFIMWESCIR
ncbi:uncharacterized protein DNG_04278 [Cephalotrichum gorgonifer]|uniref:Transcription factor domain-containing protein n=1 Tax=Cephalotrichum gorgonifer TaxID=2041049 RepID=A0AAE8SUE4_9PEZI|nr:uncharacterized protein DNG_04278 [Cephalotrichum gorgonifer]